MNEPDKKNCTVRHELTPEEKKRSAKAKEFFCSECEKSGMSCSFEHFSGWKEYVDGNAAESQLPQTAVEELGDIRKDFGKYIVLVKEDQKPSREEAEKRERARRANKIYKGVCKDAGVSGCYFQNFGTWSQFMRGEISEAEFARLAKLELDKKVAQLM